MNDINKIKSININFSEPRVLEYLYKEDYWLEKIKTIRTVFDFKNRVNITVVNDLEELSGYFGVSFPSWVVGTYYYNDIYMLKYEAWKSRNLGTFAQVMTHEFTHIALNYKLKQKCPIWVNEGLALYFAEQYKTIRLKKENVSEEDIYKIDYTNTYLYDISAKAMEKLVSLYGIEIIVGKVSTSMDFARDEILGSENMKKILINMRNGLT